MDLHTSFHGIVMITRRSRALVGTSMLKRNTERRGFLLEINENHAGVYVYMRGLLVKSDISATMSLMWNGEKEL
jgi:hypothetical protein